MGEQGATPKESITTAGDFLKQNTKTILLDNDFSVKIRKINPLCFLSLGGIPITPSEVGQCDKNGHKKPKGIVLKTPDERLKEIIERKIDGLEVKLKESCEDDIDAIIKITEEINDLTFKIQEISNKSFSQNKKMLEVIIVEGLVSPSIKDGEITINDLSSKDIATISSAIIDFSGMKGGGAEALQTFPEQQ